MLTPILNLITDVHKRHVVDRKMALISDYSVPQGYLVSVHCSVPSVGLRAERRAHTTRVAPWWRLTITIMICSPLIEVGVTRKRLEVLEVVLWSCRSHHEAENEVARSCDFGNNGGEATLQRASLSSRSFHFKTSFTD